MKKTKVLIIIISIFLISGIIIGGYYTTNYFIAKKSNEKIAKKVTLKDDFYDAINGDFLASLEIPAGEVGWGTTYKIILKIQDEEKEMVKELLQDKNNNYNMYIYYNNVINKSAREELGFAPIKPYMERIDAVKNINEFLDLAYEFDNEIGTSIIWDISLEKNHKDKSKKNIMIYSIDDTCAKYNEPSYIQIIEANKELNKKILVAYGYGDKEAEQLINSYYETIRKTCAGSLSLIELSDIDNWYHLYSLEEAKQIYSNIDIEKYLKDYHLNEIDSFVIQSETTAKAYNNLFVNENLELLKMMAKLSILQLFINDLAPSFEKIYVDTVNKLMGVDDVKSDEDKALERTKEIFSDVIEAKFILKYKDEMAHNIQLTKEVVEDIKQEYYNNIKSANWMSENTKQKALKKLDNLTVRVGYSEKFKDFSSRFQLKSYEEGGGLVQNTININQVLTKKAIDEFFSDKEDNLWSQLYTDEVNAYYNPDDNSINILLGILFVINEDADYYEIMGTIGSIVGHEITHAFDFTGSKFDELGNYINWWQDEDIPKFNAKKQEVIEYYKHFKYNDMNLNTELEAGENMADLGSMETIMKILLKKNASNDDYKKLFESFARLYANKYTDAYIINRILNDEHAPDKIRVNAVLSNLEKFYEVYDIQEGDGMYIDPSKRISIWEK